MLTLDDPPVSEFAVQPVDADAQPKVSLGHLRRLVQDYNDQDDVIGYYALTELPDQYLLQLQA